MATPQPEPPVPGDTAVGRHGALASGWGPGATALGLAAMSGALLGFSASASNAWPSALMYVLNAGWAWAGIIVLGGWFARHPRGGMVTGFLAGVVANTTYFLGDSWWSGAGVGREVIERTSFASYLPELGFWVLVAALMAPGLGAVGAWQRRRDLVGLLAVLVVPVGASVEMLLPRRWGEDTGPEETVVRWLVWVVAVTVAVWAVDRYRRWRRHPDPQRRAMGQLTTRGQTRLIAGLASVSLVFTVGMAVVGTGVLHPGQLSAGLNPAQQEAELIARVEVTDTDSDGAAVARMTRAHRQADGELPALEFTIEPPGETAAIDWSPGGEYVVFMTGVEPPHRYRPVTGAHAVLPLDENGVSAVGLPDWLDQSLDIDSPDPG